MRDMAADKKYILWKRFKPRFPMRKSLLAKIAVAAVLLAALLASVHVRSVRNERALVVRLNAEIEVAVDSLKVYQREFLKKINGGIPCDTTGFGVKFGRGILGGAIACKEQREANFAFIQNREKVKFFQSRVDSLRSCLREHEPPR